MDFKKILPHAGVVLLFAVLTLIYFNPLLSGKAIRQGDVMNFKGMSQEIVEYRMQYDKEPLWTNSMFSGMPAYQISVLYPYNLVRKLHFVLSLGIVHPAAIVFISLTGFYFLLISLGAELLIALLGALAFGFSSYFFELIEAGHNPKGYAMGYMAPVVMGMLMAYRKYPFAGTAAFAIALALQLSMNHLQITYYTAMLAIFVAGAEFAYALKNKTMPAFVKSSALLALAAVLAVGPNLTNLLVTQEYGKYSTRGKSELTDNAENKTTGLDKDYATQWSYGISESFSLMIPNFKGGQSQAIQQNSKDALKDVDPDFVQYIGQMNQYWGDQPFTSGPFYAGAFIIFMAVLALFLSGDRLRFWLLGAIVLSFMLGWGKNLMPVTDFFMDFVPGYNKFRAVSMTLVIAEFCIPLLAVLGLMEVLKNPAIIREKQKLFLLAFSLTAGLCLIFYAAPTVSQDFFSDVNDDYNITVNQLKQSNFNEEQISRFMGGIETARIAIFRSDAIRSFLFILVGAAALFIYSLKPYSKSLLLGGLAFLVFIDLWTVDHRYLNKESFVSKASMDVPFSPSAANEMILKDPDPNFRVINVAANTFNDASTSYFHKSIGGYHGAKLKRYQELIEFQISKNNMKVLNMLNAKYFIVADKQSREPVAQINSGALGNAWFVKEIKWVPNADEEIKALTDFEPSNTIVVDERFRKDAESKFTYDSNASIKLSSYKADELVYNYQSSAPQMTVFSEIFYDKGWNAYIDGKLMPHFRANYVLRAMVLPAGNHKIEFKFEPQSYLLGEKLSLAGSVLLFVFAASLLFVQFRKGKALVKGS
jgi:hypothetical protein